MTQKELNELLEQVEEEFRIFERPSANNSRKMMKFLQETVKNNGVLPFVNARFPEKGELEKECTAYMESVIKETDYRDRPIHLKYAFKAGINYLNEFLNGS